MIKLALLAFLAGTTAFAQTTSDPCNVPTGTPLPNGCFPLTYKPADGGPERPVFLGYTPGTPTVPAPSGKGRGGAAPAASRASEFSVGIDASYNKTDYGNAGNILTGAYVNFTTRRFGVEANASYTAVARVAAHENTIVVGPVFNIVNSDRVRGYIKASFGLGHFSGDPGNPGADKHNFFVQSYGGGVDLRVTKHLNVRLVDAEYEIWNSFPPSGSLSPYTVTSGIAFRL